MRTEVNQGRGTRLTEQESQEQELHWPEQQLQEQGDMVVDVIGWVERFLGMVDIDWRRYIKRQRKG